MKIKVNRKRLTEKLELLTNIITENKVRPILSHALLEVSDGKISIIGTNLEQTIICELSGTIDEEGKSTIEIRSTIELLKATESEEIELELVDNILRIDTMQFETYDVTEYPNLNITKLENENVKNVQNFVRKMKKAMFAASLEEENVEVNCVRIENDMIASTDRFRMVVIENEMNIESGISVPLNSAKALIKMLDSSSSEEMKMSTSENELVVETGDIRYCTRLISLPYVDIKSIIEQAIHEKKAIVDKKELIKICKKVLIVAKQNYENKNSAILTFSENKLEIKAISQNNKIKESIAIRYSDEKMKVSLNVKFILDFVSRVSGDVEISFESNESPFFLVDQDNMSYKYLTMPLALRDE